MNDILQYLLYILLLPIWLVWRRHERKHLVRCDGGEGQGERSVLCLAGR